METDLERQITALPLNPDDRARLKKAADAAFETVLARVDPENPDGTRRLWNPDPYVDELLKEDMLPISLGYALHLAEVLLVHHVCSLADLAEEEGHTLH